MRILYVARHNQANSTDDEGAIAHALRELGHEIECVQERFNIDVTSRCDFCLFHHWHDTSAMSTLRLLGVPLVFWNFDLVEWPDPTLEARNAARRKWMQEVTKLVDVGFCTDGDWVAKDTTGKLHWLPQGADERILGQHINPKTIDVLFTGISYGGGKDREEFVHEIKQQYKVMHVMKGTYRESLREYVGRSRIVIAPDSPVTDRYWSNRVWNACGFGAFMIHPRCTNLSSMYEDGKEIVYYDSREHMHQLIKWWLEDDKSRGIIAKAALERTKTDHTYRHRCQRMLEIVERTTNV